MLDILLRHIAPNNMLLLFNLIGYSSMWSPYSKDSRKPDFLPALIASFCNSLPTQHNTCAWRLSTVNASSHFQRDFLNKGNVVIDCKEIVICHMCQETRHSPLKTHQKQASLWASHIQDHVILTLFGRMPLQESGLLVLVPTCLHLLHQLLFCNQLEFTSS